MKLASQEGLVPGANLEEKLEKLAAWGYEGVEFWGSEWLLQNISYVRSAVEKVGLKVSTICAGYRGSVLDPDPSVRKQAVEDIKARLTAAAELGAVGLNWVLSDLSLFQFSVVRESLTFPHTRAPLNLRWTCCLLCLMSWANTLNKRALTCCLSH